LTLFPRFCVCLLRFLLVASTHNVFFEILHFGAGCEGFAFLVFWGLYSYFGVVFRSGMSSQSRCHLIPCAIASQWEPGAQHMLSCYQQVKQPPPFSSLAILLPLASVPLQMCVATALPLSLRVSPRRSLHLICRFMNSLVSFPTASGCVRLNAYDQMRAGNQFIFLWLSPLSFLSKIPIALHRGRHLKPQPGPCSLLSVSDSQSVGPGLRQRFF